MNASEAMKAAASPGGPAGSGKVARLTPSTGAVTLGWGLLSATVNALEVELVAAGAGLDEVSPLALFAATVMKECSLIDP